MAVSAMIKVCCGWGVGYTTVLVSRVREGLFEEVILGLTLNGNHGKRTMGKSEGGVLPLASLTRVPDFGGRLGRRHYVDHTHDTYFPNPELGHLLLWAELCPPRNSGVQVLTLNTSDCNCI